MPWPPLDEVGEGGVADVQVVGGGVAVAAEFGDDGARPAVPRASRRVDASWVRRKSLMARVAPKARAAPARSASSGRPSAQGRWACTGSDGSSSSRRAAQPLPERFGNQGRYRGPGAHTTFPVQNARMDVLRRHPLAQGCEFVDSSRELLMADAACGDEPDEVAVRTPGPPCSCTHTELLNCLVDAAH